MGHRTGDLLMLAYFFHAVYKKYAKNACDNKVKLHVYESAPLAWPLWPRSVLIELVLASVQARTCFIYIYCILFTRVNCVVKHNVFYSYLSAVYNLIRREYSRKYRRLSCTSYLLLGVGDS
jgi:hypothetical protein